MVAGRDKQDISTDIEGTLKTMTAMQLTNQKCYVQWGQQRDRVCVAGAAIVMIGMTVLVTGAPILMIGASVLMAGSPILMNWAAIALIGVAGLMAGAPTVMNGAAILTRGASVYRLPVSC